LGALKSGHPDVLQLWGWLSKRKASRPKRKIPAPVAGDSAAQPTSGTTWAIFADQRRFAEAVLSYREACRAHDDYAEAWIGLGENCSP